MLYSADTSELNTRMGGISVLCVFFNYNKLIVKAKSAAFFK